MPRRHSSSSDLGWWLRGAQNVALASIGAIPDPGSIYTAEAEVTQNTNKVTLALSEKGLSQHKKWE